MTSISGIKDLVLLILRKREEARSSDRVLFYLFYKTYYAAYRNKELDDMSVKDFLLDHHAPSIESIRRTRQKIQATHPELRATKIIQEARAEAQEEMRRWAVQGE